MRFQRIVQVPVLIFFFVLLWGAAYPLPSLLPPDLFLRMDPLISLGTMAASRAFIPRVAWALVVMGVALLLGRFFCGYLCPMGATIDLADWIVRRKREVHKGNSFESSGKWRSLKYLLVIALAGTAVLGISSVFFFSPLSLITRFYGLVIYPLSLMVSNLFLDGLRPVFPALGLEGLAFFRFSVPSFSTNLFVAALVMAILFLGFLRPRFWCRNLCPAGAILALCSLKPLFRRFVSEECTSCGRCLRACPTGAIGKDFLTTAHSECITCLKCREVCPEGVISFRVKGKARAPAREINLGRRKVLGAGLAGLTGAALTLSNLHHLHDKEMPAALRSSGLIRPPGALPEHEFQARCVRCGECVKGCLTNTLQPVWFEAGISGLWTPKITARLAGCEQNCNACGHLCPSGAIRPLSLEEKKFAKVGTARVIKTRCIAWEQDKSCLICDEICPYNAISNQFVIGHTVTVPVIDENRCNGCGYCEDKCPVKGEAAVVVEPLGELRLATGSYKETARRLGLVYHARTRVEDQFILNGPAREQSLPTTREAGGAALPPGFTTEE